MKDPVSKYWNGVLPKELFIYGTTVWGVKMLLLFSLAKSIVAGVIIVNAH